MKERKAQRHMVEKELMAMGHCSCVEAGMAAADRVSIWSRSPYEEMELMTN